MKKSFGISPNNVMRNVLECALSDEDIRNQEERIGCEKMTIKEIREVVKSNSMWTVYKLETKLCIYCVYVTEPKDEDTTLEVEMIDDEVVLDLPLENVVSLTLATKEEADEYIRKYEEEQEKELEESQNEKQDKPDITASNQIEEPSAGITDEELNEYLKLYGSKKEKNICYVTANAPYPCCNHTEDIGEENLGYAQGITNDGIPFEAELWETEADGKNLSIVMADLPALYTEAYEDYLKYGMKEETAEERLASQPGNNTTHTDASVLTIGMIMEEDDLPTEITAAVTAYMETVGLVRFPGRCSNGAVRFFIDMNGNRVIQNIINLDSAFSEAEAETDLVFKPFIEKKEKGYEKDGNVIRVKFGKK